MGGTIGEPTPLWTAGKTGGRLRKGRLNSIIRDIHNESGINKKGGGFHAARRARVTDYHNKGASISEITQEMGWTDETTVLGYIQPDIATTKKKIRNTWGDRGKLEETVSKSPMIHLGNRNKLLNVKASGVTAERTTIDASSSMLNSPPNPPPEEAPLVFTPPVETLVDIPAETRAGLETPAELNGSKKTTEEEDKVIEKDPYEDDEDFMKLFNLK